MISLYTALSIQSNETFVQPYQSNDSDKWGYMVTLGEESMFRELFTCAPIYDSETSAVNRGDYIVEEIKAVCLDEKRKGLADLVNGKN